MKNENKIVRVLMISTAVAGLYGMLGCEPKTAEKPSSTAKVNEVKQLYQCPMHHQIIRDHPGTCPLCGMTLVPIHGDAEHGVVRIDPAVVQNIGVRTEIVERRWLASEMRLDGRVMADESRIRSVTARVMGYVEKLNASVSGQTVHEGESLLEFYSPDLVSAQQELIQAVRYREELPQAAAPSLRENSGELVQSTHRRLLNWGVSETFANELEKTRQVQRRVPVPSPIAGVLVRKNVVEGQSVSPGMEMFQIADLSRVWITARVFQADMASVKIGSPVSLHFRNLPGRDFVSRVYFISPEMDPATRTAEIRVQLSNTPAMDLRPEMFAEVVVSGAADSVLAVPEQSILHAGERQIAIVSLGEGRFQAREVHLGRSAQGYVEILDGLFEGDALVVSSQFLIDSESNLRAVIEQMQGGSDGH